MHVRARIAELVQCLLPGAFAGAAVVLGDGEAGEAVDSRGRGARCLGRSEGGARLGGEHCRALRGLGGEAP